MAFHTPDASIIARWGEPATHISDRAETPVRLVRAEPAVEAMPAVLLTLFGTIAASGFVTAPVKGDCIVLDGERFRVYDVKSDRPGGSRVTDGLWIHLTSDE